MGSQQACCAKAAEEDAAVVEIRAGPGGMFQDGDLGAEEEEPSVQGTEDPSAQGVQLEAVEQQQKLQEQQQDEEERLVEPAAATASGPQQVAAMDPFDEEALPVPGPPPRELACTVHRPAGASWGLDIDPLHPYLQVAAFQAHGCFDQHNSQGDAPIEKDDLILRVNNVDMAPVKMLTILQDKAIDKLELKLVRPQRLVFVFRRELSQSWGFDVEYQAHCSGLFVKHIQEGSSVLGRLCTSDLVLSTNDITLNPAQMKETIKANTTLKLVILRVKCFN